MARVTDGAPCAFCAMLAGRGAVYHSTETASVPRARRCGCGSELVYGDDYKIPGRAQEFADLYAEATKDAGDGTKAKIAAFRKAYTAH